MIKSALEKYGELLSEDWQNLKPGVATVVIWHLHYFLNKHQAELDTNVKESISLISSRIVYWYNADGDWTNRVSYVEIMFILNALRENDNQAQLVARIQEFASNAPQDAYSRLSSKVLEWLVTTYPDHFRVSAVRELSIIKVGNRFLTPQERVKLVLNLLDKASSLSAEQVDQKVPYLEKIFELNCANDADSITKFYEELIKIKTEKPELVKLYARTRSLFNSAQRKKLREIVEVNPSLS